MTARITPADRSAAARFIAQNDGDFPELCELFAAHRIAAERETVEQIVEWLRESAAWHEKHDDGLSGFGHISLGQTEAADAIEQGDWRND